MIDDSTIQQINRTTIETAADSGRRGAFSCASAEMLWRCVSLLESSRSSNLTKKPIAESSAAQWPTLFPSTPFQELISRKP